MKGGRANRQAERERKRVDAEKGRSQQYQQLTFDLTQGEAMKKILGYVRDEQGIETLEWIAVGALIVAVALVVYPGTLQQALLDVVASISGALTGILT